MYNFSSALKMNFPLTHGRALAVMEGDIEEGDIGDRSRMVIICFSVLTFA
jgi:hypothetical protein